MIKILSSTSQGFDCNIVEVETDLSNGLPIFNIVGLGDATIREAKERIRSSIKNSGLDFPQKRKTINLAPAQIKKKGTHFDLPIAIGILIESGQIEADFFKNTVVIGELSLSGDLKKVDGAIVFAQNAKENGFKKILLPEENALEASFIEGIEVFAIKSLKDLVQRLKKPFIFQAFKSLKTPYISNKSYCFSSIFGNFKSKEAAVIAVAGRHNIMFSGPPGTGKTMIARAIRDFLVPMNKDEIIETTKIYSLAGKLQNTQYLIYDRPFREVHHSSSVAAIVGGGNGVPAPGEISLAHNGVLFLDEINEFPRSVIESLRQAIEDKYININRAEFKTRFPANFLLIATQNPCPCGYYGADDSSCNCSFSSINNYQKKISGPIRERFDIFVQVNRDGYVNSHIEDEKSRESEIKNAIKRQEKRLGLGKRNSDLELKDFRNRELLSVEAGETLEKIVESKKISNRVQIRILRVAQTIADLRAVNKIESNHILEAFQYRA